MEGLRRGMEGILGEEELDMSEQDEWLGQET